MTSPTTSSPAWRSVLPVSTTSAIASATPSRTADSTAPSSRITVASTPCCSRWRRTTPGYDVAIRSPARSVASWTVPVGAANRKREPPYPSPSTSSAGGAGVEQQVAAGDAEVEGALAHVDGDVARAEVEELDPVVGVGQHQLAVVGALAVAGLAEDLARRLGQRALVGHRDAQRGAVPFGRGHRGRSQVRVDVVGGQAAGQHEHLGVVQQLADLLGRPLRGPRARPPSTTPRPPRPASCR